MVVGAAQMHVSENRLHALGAVVDELGLVPVATGYPLTAMAAVVRVE